MKVKLHLIVPSPHPVRTSWDEGKMEELSQSIQEQGVVVPVKLRPVDDKYEIVYGQRRVEAARQAGLYEIEAIVEEVDNGDMLVQALIENVVREDLGPMDTARGLKALQEATGWSQPEIARRGIMSQPQVTRLLALLREPEEIINKMGAINNTSGIISDGRLVNSPVTEGHIRETRRPGLSDGDRIDIIRKVEREGLTCKQTRYVADAISRVPDDRLAKLKLLDTPVVRDKEAWTALAGFRKEQVEAKEAEVYDHLDDLNVKAFVEVIRVATSGIREQWRLVEKGLVGAEHMPYLAGRLRRLATELNAKAEQLEEKRAEEVDERC